MRRAKLKVDEVSRIIIAATMTPPHPDSLTRLIEERQRKGFLDIGCHYFIANNGIVSPGVPSTERGCYSPMYEDSSVTVVVNGGKNDRGEFVNNFNDRQMQSLRKLVDQLIDQYPKAEPTLYWELYRGINPVFTHEDY